METGLPGVGTIIIFFVTQIRCANPDDSEISADYLGMQKPGEEAWLLTLLCFDLSKIALEGKGRLWLLWNWN